MIAILRERLAALPSLPMLAAGALAWAASMGASAGLHLRFGGWQTESSVLAVTAPFVVGGLLAFPVALVAATLVARRPEARFAAAFVALTVASAGATAFFYGLQYRIYYSEWHGAVFSRGWIYQTVFTMAAAVYQFLVLGLRLYFPLGFVALFAASLWFARRAR